MTKRQLIALCGGTLVILYPFLIYFGLQVFDPRWIALLVIAAVVLRLTGARMPLPFVLAFAAALVVACGATLITGSELGLLLYPVAVNALLLCLFLFSWWKPPSVVESLARLQEPDLPPSGVAYTHKVTLVWAAFFALNGTLAALTIPLGKAWWTLYNGLVAYLLMGVLFTGEWLVRQRVREQPHVH